MSHDRTKGIIVLKHKAPGKVVVRPVGLLPEHEYLVEFDSKQPSATRTGADLMAKGIVIEKLARSGVIFLGLPNRPGSGRDKTPPRSPGAVATRWESNIGHSGVGVYWSPGADDNWISYYEVRRGETVLGRAANGHVLFRSLGGGRRRNRNTPCEPSTATATRATGARPRRWPTSRASRRPWAAISPRAGRDGWKAEASTDGRQFQPMTWIPPPHSPAADFGGTAQQPGGVEGYWEAAGTARVGRGWQQASTTAQCVRAWIAPKAGPIRVVGRAMKEYYHRDKGDPLRVRILHNDKVVWPKDGWAEARPGDLVGATHDVTLDVAAGDTIRFVLDRSTDPENDLLAWMPQITLLDAPPDGGKASVVRILCGASRPYVDQTGNEWSADRFFEGGEPMANHVPIADARPTLERPGPLSSGTPRKGVHLLDPGDSRALRGSAQVRGTGTRMVVPAAVQSRHQRAERASQLRRLLDRAGAATGIRTGLPLSRARRRRPVGAPLHGRLRAAAGQRAGGDGPGDRGVARG